MKIIFLGTNGWYDTYLGNTICTLIKTQDFYIILDAGNGLYKIDRHITDEKPVFLFLSHFHLDHIIGLHILNKFKFKQGIHICGPQETRNILGTIVNAPYTLPLTKLPYPTEIYELPEELSKLPFAVETMPLMHSSLTLGYKFNIEGKSISYCPDTGYCSNAVELAKDADMLIAECAYKSGQFNESWPHLNPEKAAELALNANAKRLALIHFDASLYPTIQERMEAESQAKKIFKNTFVTIDDMEIEL